MPYIKEQNRHNLDDCIVNLVQCLRSNIENTDNKLSNEELLNICGDINYCVSKTIGMLIPDITYPKVAIITGVLENIKQEFYRRIASPYEDTKIFQNGDLTEYRNARTR